MKEQKMKIEYVPLDSVKMYERNAKLHPEHQVEQIKKSITDYGMRDPIGVWKDEIVEGHGRWLACKELGMKMGKMHEAKILGEAGNSEGAKARGEYDFPYAKVYIESDTPSSSSAAPSSSSIAPQSSSSGTTAIQGIRPLTTGSNTSLVFDAQGKFLTSFETENDASLTTAIKTRFHSGVFLVKQGGTVRSITVK